MSSLGSVAIVGASLAGMNAANTLRKSGFSGRITVIDADHRTPYDKPPLSKQVLKGDWDADRVVLAAAKADLDLDWRLGWRATSLDLAAHTVSLAAARRPGEAAAPDGATESVSFDGLILAAGAAPRRLPFAEGVGGVHVLRSLDDCLGLRADLDRNPERVVVVGAGFIGSEVAAVCRERGLAVTIIEALEVPLERALGRRMGLLTADIHREHGVDLRLGTGLDGVDVDSHGGVERVRLADGSTVDSDVVVVGIGVVPATDWLEGSGLTIDNGIVVDDTLLAAPGVVAAGDIARWPSHRFGEMLRVEHWENAIQMGEAAARRLLVADDAMADVYDPVPWFWSDQYDRKIQLAGRSGPDDHLKVVIGSVEERRFVALYRHDDRVVGVLGMNRPRQVMQLRQLVVDATPWDEAVAAAEALD